MTQIEFDEVIKDGQRSLYDQFNGDISKVTRAELMKLAKEQLTKATKCTDEGKGRAKVNAYLGRAIAYSTLALRLSL